ncbi:MAG: hypothetical protein JOZ78_13275 [Chroococcidiopsidaceae cyanobacterium CP_BM_ER_R8_30]|nr:hypothetical protein [Chroococcidiopsidaceae cyanobacterium CP_BM_ER_R8_30]
MLWHENFAYATGWDDTKQRYLGLKAGPREPITIAFSNQSLLVKPDVAQRQLDADEAAKRHIELEKIAGQNSPNSGVNTGTSVGTETTEDTDRSPPTPQPQKQVQRFYGAVNVLPEVPSGSCVDFVKVNPTRFIKDAGQIADEVIQHLTGLVSAEVQVTMDIQVRVPDGIPDHVVRTITENCRVLKFMNYGFEAD